eukprot:6760249-Pyramimonas_sp.AAC.1
MMRIGFQQGWWGSACFPMRAVARADAPDTLCACPERGAPGAAGVRSAPGARGACGASGAPGMPGTLGHERRAHGVGSGFHNPPL